MGNSIYTLDRILRFIVGVALLTLAFAGGPKWTYIGFFFLVTGSFGTCPIYWFLRINQSEES